MVDDFGADFIKKRKYQNQIDLSLLRPEVDSGDMLRSFLNWRDEMWKAHINKQGNHNGNDPTIYKNPAIYGYRYNKRSSTSKSDL